MVRLINELIDYCPPLWRHLWRCGFDAGFRYRETRDTAPRLKGFDAYRAGWWKGFDANG